MFTRTHRVALTSIALAFASPATADSVVTPIDESTFLQLVTKGPHALALGDRARAAYAAVGTASVVPNPTLSYEREAVPSLDTRDDYVRLGWTLDVAGRRGLARGAARAGADAERAGVEHAVLALQLDARLAFLDALYTREHLARLDDARTALQTIVDSLRTRSAQGDASSYDFERAALELELLDDERMNARRELAIAQLRLGGFIGRPTTPYDATGTVTLPRPLDQSLAPARSDVLAARARERQADRELASARRTWIPRFDLVVGMIASASGPADGLGYIVGIGGELPVFDRGGAHAAKARAEVKRWRSEADALALTATAEVAQAHRELALRIEQAEAYAAGPAKHAVDLQKRAIVAYREGDRSILELLDVQRTARDVLVHVLELAYRARRAELALWRALGRTP